ncbi:MAG: PEP-CTERM sorting domain-containing protein [Rubrivivax sp.]
MADRRFVQAALAATLAAAGNAAWAQGTPQTNLLADGSFEAYSGLIWYSSGPGGERWGRPWNNGWTEEGLQSSWRNNQPGGAWSGGQVNRTEDFAGGWKWARTGDIYGIIKDRQTVSQTFTFAGTELSFGALSWFDANRPSWRGDTYFGRPNDYSVTLTDALGNTQLIGSYTSQVFGGSQANSEVNLPDARWDLENKQGWYAKAGQQSFMLTPGMTYTLSFNSLSPYHSEPDGSLRPDDRTTFLDDISLTAQPVPEPSTLALTVAGAAMLGFVARRRRREVAAGYPTRA